MYTNSASGGLGEHMTRAWSMSWKRLQGSVAKRTPEFRVLLYLTLCNVLCYVNDNMNSPPTTTDQVALAAPNHGQNSREARLKMVIDLILRYGRQEILKDFRPDSCIASTGLVIDVLKFFGFSAAALPVQVTIFNPPMAERWLREGIPESPDVTLAWEKEDGSWALGLGFGPKENGNASGYIGHLVALVEERIVIDLSLDQANRPARSIALSPMAFEVPEEFLSGEGQMEFTAGGCALFYRLRKFDRSYLRSKDFTDNRCRHRAAVSVRRQIQEALRSQFLEKASQAAAIGEKS